METQFTKDWFEVAKPNWDLLLPQIKPKNILEIGSFEGRSTCHAILNTQCEKITCIDTWGGGIEHSSIDMDAVEKRFDSNVEQSVAASGRNVLIEKKKCESDKALAQLLADNKACHYDFVYVDGSHQATDVILDAVLAFKLCRVGGLIGFDDYIWAENLPSGVDPIRCPKPAIDAFTTLFCRKVQILRNLPLYQIYVQKKKD